MNNNISNNLTPQPAYKFLAPRENPLEYPGKRPDSSFLLANKTVFPIRFKKGGEFDSRSISQAQVIISNNGISININEYLQKIKASPIQERYAVLGYGSNPVPGQLISKFGDNAIVPVFLGRLKNTEIVYNLISNKGYAFAEILINQYGINAPVGLTLLDDFQINTMIETEENYRIAYAHPDLILESGEIISGGIQSNLYMFAGFRKTWVPKNLGVPVPITELPSEGRKVEGLTQYEVLNLAIQQFELNKLGIDMPLSLINRIRKEESWPDKPPKIKYLLQKEIESDPDSLPSLYEQLNIIESLEELRFFSSSKAI